MPFDRELYAVNFNNGNLTPHVNPNGWPAMVLFPAENNQTAEISNDNLGLRLLIKPTTDTGASIDVMVFPPGGVEINSRHLLRVTFDLPWAEGFPLGTGGPEDGVFEPIPSLSDQSSQVVGYESLDQSAASTVSGPQFTTPESWAVVLSFSPQDFLSSAAANVTCQFNPAGVRVNTPGPLQIVDPINGSADRANVLIRPLDYHLFQERGDRVALFTLEHSFCGYNAEAIGHTAGCGFLTVAIPVVPSSQAEEVLQDHRVYTSDKLTSVRPRISTVPTLGVSLGTQTGVGRMSVRLRSFAVWVNDPLP